MTPTRLPRFGEGLSPEGRATFGSMAKKLYPITIRRPNYELGFSKNGTAAYEAGERPLVMWADDEREGLEETIPHHES